ncbi:alpha/beta fold hydrolase [Nocardia sp. NPDC088792]|uniref:alpha/beta fold hydrolase n=1 Tax=Nocardia sp. NPDC088792 TaxID=3364332 RepID=UPI00381A172C
MTDLRTHRFTARDGHELAYREIGEGRPLVLLHGFTADSTQWLDHGRAYALAESGHRVILPDLRGHGESTRSHDPAAYPPDILAEDGLALIDRLEVDDYDLGGYSLGARTVLRMLVRGARPARAVIAGQGLDAITSAATNGTNRRVLTALAGGAPIAPGSPDAQVAHWITHLGGDPQALLHVLDSLVATPRTALHRIHTPTLVAAGDQDHDHASADELAAALPIAQFTRVPGNHWTALTSLELATLIGAFLADRRRDHSLTE